MRVIARCALNIIKMYFLNPWPSILFQKCVNLHIYINCTARRRYFSYTIQLGVYCVCFVVSGGRKVEHWSISGGRTLTPVHRPPFRKSRNCVQLMLPAPFGKYTKRRLSRLPDVYARGSKGWHIGGECVICRWWHWWYMFLTHCVLFPSVGAATRSVLEDAEAGSIHSTYVVSLNVICPTSTWIYIICCSNWQQFMELSYANRSYYHYDLRICITCNIMLSWLLAIKHTYFTL